MAQATNHRYHRRIGALSHSIHRSRRHARRRQTRTQRRRFRMSTQRTHTISLNNASSQLVGPARANRRRHRSGAQDLPSNDSRRTVRRTVQISRPIRAGTFPTPIARRFIRTRTQIRRPFPHNANSSRQRHRQMRMGNTSRAFTAGTLIRGRHRRRASRRHSTSGRTTRSHRIFTHGPPAVIFGRPLMLHRANPFMNQRGYQANRQRSGHPRSVTVRTRRGSRRTKHRRRFQ